MNSGMAMRTNDAGNRFLTRDEEERLGESVRKVLIADKPNPNREGCPHPIIIRDLAFHKKIGTPETFEQVTAHMAECSACVRDALAYAEEYKERKKRRRTASMAFAVAATILIVIALWAVWRIHPTVEIVDKSRNAPDRPPAESVATTAGSQQNNSSAVLKFEPVTINLPSRWRGAATPSSPIILPRAPLQLEIRLPLGSPEGTYKLRITDPSGKIRTTLAAPARTTNGLTSLKATLDTSSLPLGNYTLSILEPNLDEWANYALSIQ